MFCGKCGSEIKPELGYCEHCTNKTETTQQPPKKQQNSLASGQASEVPLYEEQPITYVETDRYSGKGGGAATPGPINPTPGGYPPYIPERRMRRSGGTPVFLYVLLGVVIAAFIALIAYLLIGRGGIINGGDAEETQNSTSLVLSMQNEYRTKTRSGSYTLRGSVEVSDRQATLKINGKTVEIFEPRDGLQDWSYNVSIVRGENSFEVVLDDGKEDPVRENVTVTNLLYEKGTVLVKHEKGIDEGINIRSEARTNSVEVSEIGPYEYDKELVCQGVEKLGPDGFVWIRVSVPWDGNKLGWVRENIVQQNVW